MKIGILTYHRAENYGALLQAYALRTYLLQSGYDVEFVDYWPDYHEDYYRIFPRYRFRSGRLLIKLNCLYNLIVWGIPRHERKVVMQRFMTQYLGLAPKARYTNDKDFCREFDVVVYGSDQIWRKQNLPRHRGLDLWYFGASNIEARMIAYAASMGPSKLSEKEKGTVRQLLEGFSAISVREASLQGKLESLGIKSTLVSDPVFLLGKDDWLKLAESAGRKRDGEYIVFYNLLDTPESTSFANKFSKKTGLPIYEITKKYGFRYLGKRYLHSASVPEFLSLIRDARYVISNSFHGVALSVILEKQFYAVGMENRSDRVESLLKVLGISGRYLKDASLEEIEPIDYEDIRRSLASFSGDSRQFLADALR